MQLQEFKYPSENDSFEYGDKLVIFQDGFNIEGAYIGIYIKPSEDNENYHQVLKFEECIWKIINVPKSIIAHRYVSYDNEIYNLRKALVTLYDIKFELPTRLNGGLNNGKWRTTFS